MSRCFANLGEQHSNLNPDARSYTGNYGKIKIGIVARYFKISVDLLRLYEREGLLIPLRSPRGTRYFTELDFTWIRTVLRLVREARLNFSGIRHLLALLPCWQIQQCGYGHKGECPVARESSSPCWTNRKIFNSTRNCYYCPVYRAAPSCENLKALLAMAEVRAQAPISGVSVNV